MKHILLWLVCFVCLTGCTREEPTTQTRMLVLERGEGYRCHTYAYQVPLGENVTVSLDLETGYRVTGVDYPDYTLAETPGGVDLTLCNVRYNRTLRLTLEKSGACLVYDPNGGEGEAREIPVGEKHLRWNTQGAMFTRAGHTLVGWNTRADGTGEGVSLGSRIRTESGMVLYAQWQPWSDEGNFTWEQRGDGIAITGYRGEESVLVIPGAIRGMPVRTLAAGALAGCVSETVIFPDTLWTVEAGALAGAGVRTLHLFDNLRAISDHSFSGCDELQTLRIHGVEPPVYSGTYYATFADKLDRLISLAGEKKLVLFSGSSTRFGYDSARLTEALAGYEVVNMGVFAYTNALPQLEIIRRYMAAGDILLHSPELDAAQRQFCTSRELDEAFFRLAESDYDMVAILDLRQYSRVFESFGAFLKGRWDMEPRSYSLWPGDFDEDGEPVDTPSYNLYGDYIRYRPNAPTDTPVYGLAVPYVVEAYPEALFLEPMNRVIHSFQELGIRFYLTWSPRNAQALSPESTPQARARLEAYFREKLDAPILGTLEDSLWPGTYLYGTDNHLSTEGVALRTEQVLAALQAQLAGEGE